MPAPLADRPEDARAEGAGTARANIDRTRVLAAIDAGRIAAARFLDLSAL